MQCLATGSVKRSPNAGERRPSYWRIREYHLLVMGYHLSHSAPKDGAGGDATTIEAVHSNRVGSIGVEFGQSVARHSDLAMPDMGNGRNFDPRKDAL